MLTSPVSRLDIHSIRASLWGPPDFRAALSVINSGGTFSVDALLNIHNPASDTRWSIAHILADRGTVFSLDELLRLGNPPDLYGNTPAHVMARRGHIFPLDHLLRLGNPGNRWNLTPAHWVARAYHFTVDDLQRLGNPAISSERIVYLVGDIELDSTTLYEMGVAINFPGATVAHIMAREGWRFSPQDLQRLGDPQDAEGRTISDWMQDSGA
jgi:ankyrin repeat protein